MMTSTPWLVVMLLTMIVVLIVCIGIAIDKIAHRPPRARTCGTCWYCDDAQQPGLNAHEGFCCRKAYPLRDRKHSDATARPVVRLDWRGCGESWGK
jgi:hypothetical protein